MQQEALWPLAAPDWAGRFSRVIRHVRAGLPANVTVDGLGCLVCVSACLPYLLASWHGFGIAADLSLKPVLRLVASVESVSVVSADMPLDAVNKRTAVITHHLRRENNKQIIKTKNMREKDSDLTHVKTR